MAFRGLDHVVVRVADLDAAVAGYNKILGIEPDRQHSDEFNADQAFYRFENGTFLELISPTGDDSPIAGSLAKLGDGIHTVAFAVDDQQATVDALDAEGVRTIAGTFVHPRAANGVLVQLSERS
jgi:methylmalonyl-CoA/ethylmalonyl-CoA epimerase